MAEFSAQQTGVGGLAIVSPGLPASPGAGSGSNFVNVLVAGDPVSQLDSRFGVEPACATAGLKHYGLDLQVGLSLNNAILEGLDSALLAGKPAGESIGKYVADSFLAPVDLVAGDTADAKANLSPAQLAFSTFSLLNHAAGWVLTLLADEGETLPQLIAANHLTS